VNVAAGEVAAGGAAAGGVADGEVGGGNVGPGTKVLQASAVTITKANRKRGTPAL
jgi:hypothetical protein